MKAAAEFQAIDWFDIKGRGRVALCKWPEDGPAMKDVMGQVVRIDGELYRVQGIETFRPIYAAPFGGDDEGHPPRGQGRVACAGGGGRE
jgi:hypothetical protein